MNQIEGRVYGRQRSREQNSQEVQDLYVRSRKLPALNETNRSSSILITHAQDLYIEGSKKELEAIIHCLQEPGCIFGKTEEFRLQSRHYDKKPDNSVEHDGQKTLFVRFKHDYQAALVYKAINFYYEEHVQRTPGHMRSYFSKQKFCFQLLRKQNCRNDSCKFLHENPGVARYYYEGDVVNFKFDRRLAEILIKDHQDDIRNMFKNTPTTPNHGFLAPTEILSTLGFDDDDDSLEDSNEELVRHDRQTSPGMISSKTRSPEYSVTELDADYFPKLTPDPEEGSISPSSPKKASKLQASPKDMSLDSPMLLKAPPGLDFATGLEARPSYRPYSMLESNPALPMSTDEFDDILCEINNYIKVSTEEDTGHEALSTGSERMPFSIRTCRENLDFLNDKNDMFELCEDYNNTDDENSGDYTSHKEIPPSWGPDMFDENAIPMYRRGFFLLDLYDDSTRVLGSDQKLPIGSRNSRLLSAAKLGDGDFASSFGMQEESILPTHALKNGGKMVLRAEPIKSSHAPHYRTPQDIFAESVQQSHVELEKAAKACEDQLVYIGMKDTGQKGKSQAIEVVCDGEKPNSSLFKSRADRKKERQQNKKQRKKQKLGENQEPKQPELVATDSMELSCIQKQYSKSEHSEDEEDILSMIEQPNLPITKSFEPGVKDESEAIANIEEEEDKDEATPEDADQAVPEAQTDEKKTKKKKKKKKASPTNQVQSSNPLELFRKKQLKTNKLSNFQKRLLSGEKPESSESESPKQDIKDEQPRVEPVQSVEALQEMLAHNMFSNLRKERNSNCIDTISNWLTMMDTSPYRKVLVDAPLIGKHCKVQFVAQAK